ncbi:hypothetical protein FGSG_10169 [Fusarium graminearum PH-1]|uniref:hypothetical protein n=1 Tax=Gibberella zeae (strain ATCC MYA-4620 / CBS 123657 / FGSC 9075 / NRRL 31084 / PH-1) TaxID=229533 RepID=UPI00021F1889|nr:hypothetical protein FGSG_10169 [Fusarium graminearum PH-1]ESU16848.1 hypothetical protein FGSG_10169 [Fusarium graminearum PH-1]|eukprot:XP_011319110.1 hypothetical protein FGSG_10169 [Fusarium graminearum PH-1]
MKLYTSVFAVLALTSGHVTAQTVDISATSELTFFEGTRTQRVTRQTGPPTGAYSSYASKITLSFSSDTESDELTSTLTGLFPTDYTDSTTITSNLTETATATGTTNGTSTTATKAKPTNTQPCNNYVELCKRKYGNITMVGCHNSPFVRPGNSGSNQELQVETQLDDGVRFLQGQIQFPANSSVPHFFPQPAISSTPVPSPTGSLGCENGSTAIHMMLSPFSLETETTLTLTFTSPTSRRAVSLSTFTKLHTSQCPWKTGLLWKA